LASRRLASANWNKELIDASSELLGINTHWSMKKKWKWRHKLTFLLFFKQKYLTFPMKEVFTKSIKIA
jgi:hypothetical protein